MAFVNHSNQWNQGHKSLLVSEGNIDRQQYRVTEAPSGSLVNFWALLMQINIFAFCGIGQLSILIWYERQTDTVIYRSS